MPDEYEWVLELPWLPEDWNTYIRSERSSKYLAAKIKESDKNAIAHLTRFKPPYTGGYPCKIMAVASFKNLRRDLDNLRLKGIIDGLVGAGKLENDNLNHIQRITITGVKGDKDTLTITIKPLKTP